MKNSLSVQTVAAASQRFKVMLATAFWFGMSPTIPGTVGTIPAVILFIGTALWIPAAWQWLVITGLLVASCILCVSLGEWAEKYWGVKDPRHFVLDEVAGFFLTVLLFRVPDLAATVLWGFVATRAFDIIKPPPASSLEVLSAGWGILIDDLIASLYAAVFLHAAARLLPSLFGL
ncbi:MAG: phosphatidylglycerophosphatase A family protein [Desulfomonilaceae bacterium]